jgi:epoxyqueuosine reductase QueG
MDYNKKYYAEIYRKKLQETIYHCDICNKDYCAWSIKKHYQTKKHKLNEMPPEERFKAIEEDYKNKKIKRLNKLKEKIENEIKEY